MDIVRKAEVFVTIAVLQGLEWIARGAIPLDEALPIPTQIAEALEAAHEQAPRRRS